LQLWVGGREEGGEVEVGWIILCVLAQGNGGEEMLEVIGRSGAAIAVSMRFGCH